jgi:hypothetical protein
MNIFTCRCRCTCQSKLIEKKRSINKEEEQKFVEQNDRVQKFVDERLAQAARQTLTRHKYNYWNSKKDEKVLRYVQNRIVGDKSYDQLLR